MGSFDMEKITTAVLSISRTSGRNDKINLLKRHADIPGFKELMKFIYDPYVKTGIGTKKLAKRKHDLVHPSEEYTLERMIQYYNTCQTGQDMDIDCGWYFINAQQSKEAKDLAKAFVTKTLKIGVTSTTLNSVYGDTFIPKIGLMLGEKYSEYKNKVKGPFIATEKLDGIRRILIKENGKISMYSRSGIPDEGLIDIETEAIRLPDNTMYDGELLAIGDFADSIALRQATNSIANSKGVRHGLSFNIFDSVPILDYKEDTAVETAIQRKAVIAGIFGDEGLRHLTPNWANIIEALKINYDFKFIKAVPILGMVVDENDFMPLAEKIWANNGEGLMLNTIEGLYRIKRSSDLLKLKKVESMDLKIIDFETGSETGKYFGTLGNLVVDYNGNRVGVGSGISDDLRHKIWNNKEDYLGLTVEIDTFGESTDKNGNISLNCAIFKGIRYDK